MKMATVIVLFVCLLSACNVNSDDNTVVNIVDNSSGRVVSKYYLDSTNTISRTESFGTDKLVSRQRSFEYDENGYVRTLNETTVGKGSRTVNYSTNIEYDSQNRVSKIIRLGDDGTTSETVYGYDENGTLRAVGVTTTAKDGKKSVVMKDYANE